MVGRIVLFCLLVGIVGCSSPKVEMSCGEVSSLYTMGKIVVDDSQDDQKRVNAVKEYCEIVNELLSRGNVKVKKRFILQSLDLVGEGQEGNFLYTFRLKHGHWGGNSYYISLLFDDDCLVRIDYGVGIE